MKRPHKYGAKAFTDPQTGEKYPSLGQFRWYANLKLIQRAGAIRNLRREVPFDLHGHRGSVIATLILDAVWEENGEVQHGEFKGFETPISRLKRKLFLDEYGPIRLFGAKGEIALTKTGRRKRASTKPAMRKAA